jgi:response regulator RpfG family c-di-GMP phosphodiesterase
MSDQQGMPLIKILFVDDEENILHAMERLFLDEEFEILTANSGAKGLELLRQHPDVALIVSDQRMPVMGGVDFLAQARQLVPHALRIILTGYADIGATVDAINRGGAYRYITKPWNDDDLLQTIRDGVRQYRLVWENQELNKTVARQNEELAEWNRNLKNRVMEQTAAVRAKSEELHGMSQKFRDNYERSLQAFAGLIELRDSASRSHSKNVAALAVTLAGRVGLSAEEIEIIRVAAMLHDIGKIGIPDRLLHKMVSEMDTADLIQYKSHSVRGQAAIDLIEDLRQAGILIRNHHERMDGRGFPDALKGEAIPLGARIIGICDAIDHLVDDSQGENGVVSALEQIAARVPKEFDPALMTHLPATVSAIYSIILHQQELVQKELFPRELCEGMKVVEDVVSGTGLFLLSRGALLDAGKIQALKRYYEIDPPTAGVKVLLMR